MGNCQAECYSSSTGVRACSWHMHDERFESTADMHSERFGLGTEPLAKERMILISDNLDHPEILIQAVRADVAVVAVQYAKWSLAELTRVIAQVAGEPNHQFCSVGLLDH